MIHAKRVAHGATLMVALSTCAACDRCGRAEPSTEVATVPTASNAPASTPAGPPRSLDAVELDGCTLGHRGILLDLGDASTRGRYGAHAMSRPTPETLEREGATWTRFREKAATLQFVALDRDFGDKPENPEAADSFVAARVRGGAAKSISVYLNGKPVGNWRLTKGETKILTARGSSELTTTGGNELLLRFNGVPKAAAGEAYAEIDWIHIGRGEPDANYAAPTRNDVTANPTLDGVARRALSLRAPGFVRCTGWIPQGGTAQAFAGIAGKGDAELRMSVIGDRTGKIAETTFSAHGGSWTKAEALLGDLGRPVTGTVGAFQVEVIRATPGARVLLGDPGIVAPKAPDAPPAPHGRGVVLVVFGELQPKTLSLYGGVLPTPELAGLAARGLVFDAHRATSTLSHAALAAMLSGRTGRANGVNDFDARLPQGVTTIADVARQAGVVSAMFTANPLTSALFGFDRGWGTFVAHGPDEDVLATRVFDDAAEWIEAHKGDRFLVVIHARGGHPPWDITGEELKGLEPSGYTGSIDPKHAAELLSKARHVPPAIHFGDTDRARTWALYSHAVAAHDAALGRLLTTLRRTGRDADTTLFVTGDLSVDEIGHSPSHVPFGEGEPPEEPLLWVPLVVVPPAGFSGGRRVKAPTADVDLAPSMANALALSPSSYFRGVDLYRTLAGSVPESGRPLLATSGNRYALRLGNFVLRGSDRREDLCDVLIEPACIADVSSTHPLATEALERMLFAILHEPGETPVPREPVTLDTKAGGALKAWGR
ncbi:sulfatase-like hydrolase/transferase [Pendulispora rubella]|uniref:Sulfatase-like hydrolase/transferase n=1 Tax=Pendulispora rubella TaxID=2741070 RepID=A0ABZ2L8X4_9BACT